LSSTQDASSLEFLTRPYTTWHDITSIFDHCNPDYSTDGRVCEFDGSVGLSSYGVDPSFSRGYAQTPGGSDYLYYDGHNGWDYALHYENVLAAAPGTVTLAGPDTVNPCFGNTVLIDHGNGFTTRYSHLNAVYVSVGQAVDRGQIVGQSGNTGCSTGPHLHFGVYITSSWTAVDPWGWWGPAGADPWPADPGDLWLTGSAQFPLPAPPANVIAVAGNGTATVGWSPPGFSGGIPVTSYTVTASPSGRSATVGGSATTATVSGLSNGRSYTFTVTASNGAGASVSSPTNAVTPSSSATPIPVLATSTVNFDVQAVNTTTTANLLLSNMGGVTLNISSVSVKGNFASSNGCGTTLPPLQNCYIGVSYAPNAAGPSSGALVIHDNTRNSPQVVPLSGSGGLWMGSESLRGQLVSHPSVTTWGPGRLDVFAQGGDGSLQHVWYANNGWTQWESLGGTLTSAPAAVSWASGRIDVFARGSDLALWHTWYDGAGWHGWESLGGSLASGPSVAAWGPGRLDIFAAGSDHALWHLYYGNGGWGSWQSLGGVLNADPAVASMASQRLDVFGRGGDNALWHIWWDPTDGWSNWESLGGTLQSGPSASSWGAGHLDVFFRSDPATIGHRVYDALAGWRNGQALNGQLATAPTAVSWSDGRIDVFGQASDAMLWHSWFD
jgi:hypothetical protein